MNDPTPTEHPAALEDPAITELDRARLADAIAVSNRARLSGNHPFGAVLVDATGAVVLEAENSVTTENDCTGHAETNLVRLAWRAFGPDALGGYTLYTSCEPCAMCSGAIYWSGIGRVVFAMTEADLASLTGDHQENPTMSLSSALVLNSGTRAVEVRGPALAAQAMQSHADFWV
ncbi:nucleoside deaminase [Galbitalea soli]|uniref:Nucleoside deaminase n=1 Tax=Galbitalea soli TaxID=1268042 RepID=A0A7C9PP45_9MICO|nr:nucleoside deaminase [Galbitalea soli]NEM92085.1 nucleoside deaminase [Galbitalea soli]NYJ31963.1 tRNA(Arg) A34 adenosine deaminase TadA [Galbitalea soli]